MTANTEQRIGYDLNPVESVTDDLRSNARNMGGEKETVRTMSYVCGPSDDLQTPIQVRWYMGRSSSASVVYCSVWIHPYRDGGKHVGECRSGRGSAGGCGYHKESAALCDAIDSAGIKLSGHFGGYGDHAMEVAVRSIAEHYGFPAGTVI